MRLCVSLLVAMAAAAAALATARSNLPALLKIVAMSDSEFEACSAGRAGYWVPLGLTERDMEFTSNSSTTTLGLRKVWRAFSFVTRTDLDVSLQLLRSRVICSFCYRSGATAGIMLINTSKCQQHADTQMHKDAVENAAAHGRQTTLGDMGVVVAAPAAAELRMRARILATSSLVSGGHGAAGVPPSSIHGLMGRELLIVMGHMGGGSPSTRTIISTDLPAAVELVYDWLRNVYFKYYVTTFALSVDGGSSGLAQGRKCLAVTCLNPNAPFDVLLGVEFAYLHETGASQAKFIDRVFKLHFPEVDRDRAIYLATDNSALNFKCAKYLVDLYRFNLIVSRRCLPHCLALVMSALFSPFERVFGLASHLHSIRAFFKAGGGSSRKRHILEFGLSLCQIDFSDTRWEAFMVAVLYLVGMQSPFELTRATAVLEASAAEGDKTAKEALRIAAADRAAGLVEKPQRHWSAIYEAVDDITVDRADGEISKLQDTILSYNADVRNYGAAHLLSLIGGMAPGVFRRIQGGAAWSPELREKKTTELVTAVSSVQGLLVSLERLQYKETRKALLAETVTASRAYQEELLDERFRTNAIHIDDMGAARAVNETNLKAATTEWKILLKESSAVVFSCKVSTNSSV